jgi:hypothetical protein
MLNLIVSVARYTGLRGYSFLPRAHARGFMLAARYTGLNRNYFLLHLIFKEHKAGLHTLSKIYFFRRFWSSFFISQKKRKVLKIGDTFNRSKKLKVEKL